MASIKNLQRHKKSIVCTVHFIFIIYNTMFSTKKIIIGTLTISSIIFTSCSVGNIGKNNINNSAILGENANYITSADISKLETYIDAFENGVDAAIKESKKDKENSRELNNIIAIKEIFEKLDLASISSKSSTYIDFSKLTSINSAGITPLELLKSGFANDQILKSDSTVTIELIKNFLEGVKSAGDMTKEQIQEIEKTLENKEALYSGLFDDGKGEEIIKNLKTDIKNMGILFYSDITKDMTEEEIVELQSQLKNNIQVNAGSISYRFDPEKKLGGSLDKNGSYNQYLKLIDSTNNIYSIYLNYRQLLPVIEKHFGSSEKIVEQLNSTLPVFALFGANYKEDIKNLLDIILKGDSFGISVNKKDEIFTIRVDIHSSKEAATAANTIIKNYKDLLEGLMKGSFGVSYKEIDKIDYLTNEQKANLKDAIGTTQLLLAFDKDNFFTVGITFDATKIDIKNLIEQTTKSRILQAINHSKNTPHTAETMEDIHDIENTDTLEATDTDTKNALETTATNAANVLEATGKEIQKTAKQTTDALETTATNAANALEATGKEIQKTAEQAAQETQKTVIKAVSNDLDTLVNDLSH